MKEFRPISLCNVSYKIISKILCHRLKRELPELVSETQSAFLAKRLITDNILLAQENFHALRSNPSCNSKFMAVKTDMSKAYDRLEWEYLQETMLKLGFSRKWTALIMSCVTSVTYKVLINGEAKGNIIPKRGLRQGDPLSPFLFILCTEGLISLLNGAEEEGRISGLKIGRSCPTVSHLLFADDSLFFCKADILQSAELIDIIKTYGLASGQELNTQKSSIIFGKEVNQTKRQQVKQVLGIDQEGGAGFYLGLPESIVGPKKEVFAFIQGRLNARINNWSTKFLSKGGKEVLIKSVAQALPTYVMSCFQLPKGILQNLQKAIARFWWSTKQNNKGIHWINWEKLCNPQSMGGLGFRDLGDFNLALLAKQLWRLVHYPESLLARVLKGRYYRNSNPLDVNVSPASSRVWKSIMAAQLLLKDGIIRTIGTGANTRIWKDNWLPDWPGMKPPIPVGGVDQEMTVDQLIDRESRDWNIQKLRNLFPNQVVPHIRSIKIPRSNLQDRLIWRFTKSGIYSVRSGYEQARSINHKPSTTPILEPSFTKLKEQVWKTAAPRKLKHFMWQALSGCVASCYNLTYRHMASEATCPRCGEEKETTNHVLFECPPAFQVWALANIPTAPGIFPRTSLAYNLDYLFWRCKELKVEVLGIMDIQPKTN